MEQTFESSNARAEDRSGREVLVWDLPTRLFHWMFAGSFAVAWLTAESDMLRDVHVFSGYLMLGLLAFRLVWGVIGSRYARFSSFPPRPKAGLRYALSALIGRARRHVGHNPAGSLAIYGMLLLALLTGLLGIATLGAEEGQGPLAGFASIAVGDALGEVHEALASAMLGLVVIHLLGVAAESLLHRENLARSMLNGYKRGAPGQGIRSARRISAMLLIALVVGGSAWYFKGYALASEAEPYLPFVGKTLPDNATWRAECGSCHMPYHPTLLPARSWDAVMAGQNEHFGEVLGLPPATAAEIGGFLRANSADTGMTEPAYKIGRSIPAASAPLRITETRYWEKKHDGIEQAVWRDPGVGSRINCDACHLDALKGTFEDGAMRLPKGHDVGLL